jgi:hypothetical protein
MEASWFGRVAAYGPLAIWVRLGSAEIVIGFVQMFRLDRYQRG